MGAGQYRQVITIQQATKTANPDGQKVPKWSTYATRRAKIVPTGGDERVENGIQLQANITHVVTVRSCQASRAITPKMQILWGSRVLKIRRAYDVDNAGREVEILCEETV